MLADTEVTLTATTSKTQKTKMVKVTVKSDLEIEFDREYAKPGQLMKASVKNAPADTEFTYVWQKDKSTLSDSDSYTPTSADLNTFITVRASLKSTGATVAEKKDLLQRNFRLSISIRKMDMALQAKRPTNRQP